MYILVIVLVDGLVVGVVVVGVVDGFVVLVFGVVVVFLMFVLMMWLCGFDLVIVFRFRFFCVVM